MKESTKCCKCKKEIIGVSFIITNCDIGETKTYCIECYKESKIIRIK